MEKKEKNTFGKIPNRPYFVWIVIVCAIIMLVSLPRGGAGKIQTLDTKQLMTAVQNDSLLEISIRNDPSAGKDWYVVEGKMKNPVYGLEDAPKDAPRALEFVFSGRITDEMYKRLTYPTAPWEVKEVPSNTFWGNLVSSVLPFLIIVGVLYFLFTRQMRATGRSAMSFGKSRARLLSPDKDRVTFKDVAGCDESKEEVSEVVEFLKNPKRFSDIGARIPKGILMVGPPGTGKTLLARAVAGEADVPFYSISGSDFVEMFVGVGAARVRDMFEQARKTAPCLVFIDEIDAVGRQRGAGMGGGHDEREQTLNSLLVEMDGFDAHSGVIIIAATNRPDVLDSALLRPGRFDRQVVIDLPDVKGREEILKIHAAKIKLDPSVDLETVAKITPGCSGADLANLLNEGAIIAARRNESLVTMEDIDEARDKVFFGRERRKLMDSDEKKLTAYHEAGHTLLHYYLKNADPLHKVTIIPHGRALGLTMSLPEKDAYTKNRSFLEDRIKICMGGYVAEDIVYGETTTGTSNDIKQATDMARRMVTEWGMSSLGFISLGDDDEPLFLGREIAKHKNFSDEMMRRIDEEISGILSRCMDETRTILTEHRDQLDALTEALVAKETLDDKDIREMFGFPPVQHTSELK